MTLSHEELKSLLAASALDSLPEDEKELLDEHVVSCMECRTELSEYQATTSLMGGPAQPPPDGVWDDIVATIGRSSRPEEMPVSLRRVVRRRSKWVQGWTLVATGAVAAAIVLAVWGINLNGRVGHLQNQSVSGELSTAVAQALAAPDHQLILMRASGGTELASAVITPDGTSFLVPKALPGLSSTETYQLWALSGGRAVSLGVLGPHPGISMFRFEHEMTNFMLTAEPTGGVPAPTVPVLASGVIPAGPTGT
jgi:Anti-sigma-K factor rskA